MSKDVAICGLGFGDEGKGSVTDFICATEKVDYVVRFNGGCQAAHNVVLPDGTHHTFSQYGSGTLRNVPTILSRFMMIEPMGFLAETEALESFGMPGVPMAPFVDEDCLVTTPWHIAVNRHLEARRGDAKHGSCGLGVGTTMQFALEEAWAAPTVKDIRSGAIKWKLKGLRLWAKDQGVAEEFDLIEVSQIYARFLQHVVVGTSDEIRDLISVNRCVFEGAQGVLLDEWRGFHPYTTWSDTTFNNIAQLVSNPFDVERIGVLRAYATRHGAGPFPTESDELRTMIQEEHNDDVGHQGLFRIGEFDLVLAQYAINCCGGVDSLALTHMDVADSVPLKDICVGYEVDGEPWYLAPGARHDLDHQASLTSTLERATPLYYDAREQGLPYERAIEHGLGVPLAVVSRGPTAEDKEAKVTAAP